MAASSSSAPALADAYDIPWVEKYRPTRVADVVGNSDAVARLQVIARDGNMPNLILSVSAISSNTLRALSLTPKQQYDESFLTFFFFNYRFLQGPPGTGKTTSILSLAHELLGPSYREAVLELNASDDRLVRPWRGFDLANCSRAACARGVDWVCDGLTVDSCFCRGLDVVRNKIKMFAQKKVTLQPGRHKIVILDEADR